MQANVGDWLVMASHSGDRHAVRAEILAVGPNGAPPYRVRWLDDDRESLLFPPADARVLTPEQEHAYSADRAARARQLQVGLNATPHT